MSFASICIKSKLTFRSNIILFLLKIIFSEMSNVMYKYIILQFMNDDDNILCTI